MATRTMKPPLIINPALPPRSVEQPKPSAGSIRFLEIIRKYDQGRQRAGVDFFYLIGLLGKASPQSLESLARQAQVDMKSLSHAVTTMSAMGVVTFAHKSGRQEVKLTPRGKVLLQKLPCDEEALKAPAPHALLQKK